MALGRTLTKKLKRSVTRKFSTPTDEKSENGDYFYAISFNETNPSLSEPSRTSLPLDFNMTSTASTPTKETPGYRASISRANSINSLLSGRSSLRKTRTPSASKPPSMTSSPSTPIPTSYPVTPVGYSSEKVYEELMTFSKASIGDDIVPYQPLQSSIPQSSPFSLKYPPSHKKIRSVSSSNTGASSSCYSSFSNEYDNDQLTMSSSVMPTKSSVSFEEDSIADEVAMRILEKISAEEYLREIESESWAL